MKVWRLGPSTANGQTSGGRWSGRRRGPIEEELTSEDDLVLSDQAVLEVSKLNLLHLIYLCYPLIRVCCT